MSKPQVQYQDGGIIAYTAIAAANCFSYRISDVKAKLLADDAEGSNLICRKNLHKVTLVSDVPIIAQLILVSFENGETFTTSFGNFGSHNLNYNIMDRTSGSRTNWVSLTKPIHSRYDANQGNHVLTISYDLVKVINAKAKRLFGATGLKMNAAIESELNAVIFAQGTFADQDVIDVHWTEEYDIDRPINRGPVV